MSLRIAAVAALLATVTACGWLARPPSKTNNQAKPGDDVDPASVLPKCRPASANVKRGDPPWTKGMTTPAGWTVVNVTFQETKSPSHWPEFARVSFSKDGVETGVEVAYSDSGPGDWSTASYRLMPAPEQEPPQDLLMECIKTLRDWDAKHAATPFVKRRVGTGDIYAGLPPCE